MNPIKTFGAIALLASLSSCADNGTPGAGVTGAAPAPSVDATWLTLAPPPGDCQLDAREPVDAFIIAMSHKGIRDSAAVMAIWNDCASLAAVRQGKETFTSPVVVVTEVLHHGHEFRVPRSRSTILDQIAAALSPAGSDAFNGSVGNFAKDSGGSSAKADRKYLGMQARDENGAYFGMLSSLSNDKLSLHIGIVVALTELRGRVLEIGVFADMSGGMTVDRLVATAKDVTARILAANPEESGNQI